VSNSTKDTAGKESGSSYSGVIGRAFIGASMGAFVGTILLPGLGTWAGAKIGALMGGGGGSDFS
jgi:hypothetical protein